MGVHPSAPPVERQVPKSPRPDRNLATPFARSRSSPNLPDRKPETRPACFPLMMPRADTAVPVNTIHLINPMWDCAGSEWRTYELYRQLSPHARVRLWSQAVPSELFTRLVPIRRIRPLRLSFPRGGTMVFVGVYARIGRWLRFARPRRTILVYNTDVPGLYTQQMAWVERVTGRRPEAVFASAWLRQSVGGEGPVQVSPLDLTRFAPAASAAGERPFTVGRHSRDSAKKHHQADPALYQRLAAAGMRVRILGGTVLAPQLAGSGERIELLPLNTVPPADFLRSLDCFYYRTSAGFREPHGRVVQEAMACGLPVVAHRDGGYAAYIEHGRNGFLFETDAEAWDILIRLRDDVPLRLRVGAAARRTIEELFSPAAEREVLDFYLRGGPSAAVRPAAALAHS